MEKREILRGRVYELSDKGILDGKRIYLHGSDTYQMIKILYNCGQIPYAIVLPKKKEESLWGVKVVTMDQLEEEAGGIFFSDERQYMELPEEQLKNFQVYIEGIALKDWRISKKKLQIKRQWEDILLNGENVYESILEKYKYVNRELQILVYNYTGLGDAYIIGMLYEEYCRKNPSKEFIVTTCSMACKEVFQLFSISNIELISIEDSESLEKLALLCGTGLKIKNLMQSPECNAYIMKRFHGVRFNLFEMYQYYIFNLPQYKISARKVLSVSDGDNKASLCKSLGIVKGKSVILSPYAKSMVGFNKIIWENIAKVLDRIGYHVFTNCAGNNEKEIKGTKKISFSIKDVCCVVDYAGFFIGIRSGLCDVISETSAKKVFLYPDYVQFNGLGTYEFCSFQKMGFGKNYIEHKLSFDETDRLADIILKDFID